MDERTRLMISAFAGGLIPTAIPEDCEYAPELVALSDYLARCNHFALTLAQGDLSADAGGLKGHLPGSLKHLQANLRHLTWQTKQIAQGDLNQRVDFMGDFATSFNGMIESLQDACAALVHLSTHDSLTGLYNRCFFDTELERLAAGRTFPVGIIVSDLNELKPVNDRLGHAAGDLLIQQAAALLKGAVRCDDVVARIGGDEFAIIMAAANSAAVQATLERIHQRIRATPEVAGGLPGHRLSMALGCAVAENGRELKSALSLADARMYEDKRGQCAPAPGPVEGRCTPPAGPSSPVAVSLPSSKREGHPDTVCT